MAQNQTIIINWGWHDTIKSDPDPSAKTWQTQAGNCRLFCTNCVGDLQTMEEYARSSLENSNVLIFLHKNPPHNATEADRLSLLKKLNTPPLGDYSFRVRIFGGGTEPVYFSEFSKGVVGARGSFPGRLNLEPNRIIEPNFLLNSSEKTINQEHFDHVWNSYWDTPKNHVYNLLEDFRFYTDGFDLSAANAKESFLAHLKDYNALWHKLHCFAGARTQEAHPHWAGEYNLDDYIAYLEHKGENDMISLAKKARNSIKTILDKESTVEDLNAHLNTSYNDLFDLYKSIPLYL